MKNEISLAPAGRTVVISLLIAAAGVTMQMLSGAPYPTVPPVFFILLIPAGLIAFGKWRWTYIVALFAGVFLTLGLFTSGAYKRLFHPPNIGDSIGLWIQSIALVVVIVAAAAHLVQSYKRKDVPGNLRA